MLSALRFLKDAVQPTHPRNPTRESAVARLSRKPRILSTNYCKTQNYYAYLPAILMFYSELFNCVVFGLFSDEVDSRLFEKRLERMGEVMSKLFG